MGFTPSQLPELSGQTFAITGGNSGLGLQAAKILAGKGAKVVITCRSEEKGEGALTDIRSAVPGCEVSYILLDLASQKSVKAGAAALLEACPQLHGVINNAGVMQTPLVRTEDGFELQIATNHFGHFKLNSLLFKHLSAFDGRIVVVSSIAHKYGSINLQDLNSEQSYDSTMAYFQSKLANIMYAFELHRLLQEKGSKVKVIPCHPGYSNTNLQTAGVGMKGGSKLFKWMYSLTNKVVAQTAEAGAYPLVLAVAGEAESGVYYGPTGIGDMRGPVGPCYVAKRARDEKVSRALWQKTEELVGAFFEDAT